MSDSREFDIVVFGASGFTGKYVVEELARSVGTLGSVRWAIAGRNVEKLISTRDSVQNFLEDACDIREVSILQADVKDPNSLTSICKRTRLIFNCVGPYNLYGEAVVSACVQNGTDHVDISAEVRYMETVQATYFHKAEEKGVYIVQACGFGSLPADYGIFLMKKEFSGNLNSVEYFIEHKKGSEGRSTHVGTLDSIGNSLRDKCSSKKFDNLLDKEIFGKEVTENKHKLTKRFPLLFYSSETRGWWHDYSLFGPDARVLKRSQKFDCKFSKKRPVQSYGYFRIYHIKEVLAGLLVLLLILFSWGRKLLFKHPSFFTLGEFTSSGPTREQVSKGSSKITLYGNGWSQTDDKANAYENKPDKHLKLTISGPEIAYALTSRCIVHAGLVILQERDRLPLKGGVLTPGVAFENTKLRERLEKRGITFVFSELN